MTIMLVDNYFIEIDPLNYILKQKYMSKKKDGSEVESVRTIGYYGNFSDSIRQFLKEAQNQGDATVSIRQYAERVEESNKTLALTLEGLWRRIYENNTGERS